MKNAIYTNYFTDSKTVVIIKYIFIFYPPIYLIFAHIVIVCFKPQSQIYLPLARLRSTSQLMFLLPLVY